MDEAEYKKLKQEHDEAKAAAAEARGALNALKTRLREEFGLKDVAAARQKLKELAKKKKNLEIDFENHLKRYRDEFGK